MKTVTNVDGESGELAESSFISKKPYLKKEPWGKKVKVNTYAHKYTIKKHRSKQMREGIFVSLSTLFSCLMVPV